MADRKECGGVDGQESEILGRIAGDLLEQVELCAVPKIQAGVSNSVACADVVVAKSPMR